MTGHKRRFPVGRGVLFGRAVGVAASAALVGSLVLTGPVQATLATSNGPTFGAFDTQGHELNVALSDIFGSDGFVFWSGAVGSRSNSWRAGPDGIPDNLVRSVFFLDFDRSCAGEEPQYYPSNDPAFSPQCWDISISPNSDPGPWGDAVPMTATAPDSTPLVFDHWETTNADVTGRCFTGEVGTPKVGAPKIPGDLLVPGAGNVLVPGVGFKAWWDPSDPVHSRYTANAIYAPLSPDISAPIVSIQAPLDCQVFEQNASATAGFTCVDPGASDPNPTCVGDVANGASIGTSTVGAHTFSVIGTDASGNARTRTIHYTVVPDATPPETAIDSGPVNPSTSNSATFAFHGTDATNGIAGFECQLDAGAFVACTSPKSYPNLADGSHTFQLRAIDGAGNVDLTPAAYTWTSDTAPPDTTISSHPSNPSTSASAFFHVDGSDAGTGVAAFECRLDLGAFVACDTDPTFHTHFKSYDNLADGSHTFAARAIDGIGNVDPTPATFSWTIDTALPSITISRPAAQTYALGQSVNASYSCTDTGSGILSCVGSVANGAPIDTSSSGTKTFEVNATDNAGNHAVASVAYTVAPAPPARCLSEANHQILFPIAANGSSVYARGLPVLARFRVCDATGKSISTSGLVQRFRLVGIRTGATTVTVDQAVPSATRATAFVWDPLLRDWVFAIDTRALARSKTYLYRITLRDATTIDFAFTVR